MLRETFIGERTALTINHEANNKDEDLKRLIICKYVSVIRDTDDRLVIKLHPYNSRSYFNVKQSEPITMLYTNEVGQYFYRGIVAKIIKNKPVSSKKISETIILVNECSREDLDLYIRQQRLARIDNSTNHTCK